MNGQPLPIAHGFPARMLVPGLYGYVSATKWVTRLTLTTFAKQRAYWTQRGYSAQAPIKTELRIDVPKPLAQVKAGHVTVAGVAWAPAKGIAAVEVNVDNGPWHQATLAAVDGIDTWRQWMWDWDAQSRAAHPAGPRDRQRGRDADVGAHPGLSQRRKRLGLHRGHRHVTARIQGAASQPYPLSEQHITQGAKP